MSAVYNAAEGGELRLDSLVFGEVQSWTSSHRGLGYPGEVIVAETVNPVCGEPLEGEASFRIIIYTVPRRSAPKAYAEFLHGPPGSSWTSSSA